MDDLRQSTIQKKLHFLLKSIDDLRRYLPSRRQDYQEDANTQCASERVCQMIFECAIDINEQILKGLEQSTGRKGKDGFKRLHQLSIVGMQTLQRFTEGSNCHVNFRNLLVHVYDKIDPIAAYHTARRLIPDATRYAAEIRRYLDALEEAEDAAQMGTTLEAQDEPPAEA
ncbi:MAG: DUF86 domain-containing protein [Armatimonadetes bacterium]|nr:DUF86 domain-containing protein [Armatimonadota bacterium]